MANFNDFDTEIQDDKQRNTEHFNGNLGTAGATSQITAASILQYSYIYNPPFGPYANNPNEILYISFDGGTNFISLGRGQYIMWPGKGSGSSSNIITLKGSDDNMGYEVMTIS